MVYRFLAVWVSICKMRPNYVNPLIIGGGGQYDFFDGSLDELAIFNYAMSAANVSQLYAGYRLLAHDHRRSEASKA